jgi:hypothetical protein
MLQERPSLASANPTLYRFHPFSQPVSFTDCAELVEHIAARLAGWRVTPRHTEKPGEEPGEEPAAVINVAMRGPKYVLTSDRLDEEEVYRPTAHIICAFLVELLDAINAEMTDSLYLHAGAVEIDGKLIVYPASGKTGKSTLTAQMARAGARIHSDDVVPIHLSTGLGWSMGIETRIRLPLPDTIAPETRSWIEAHQAIASHRMAYIGLASTGPGSLVPFGETRPIGAFVRLNRAEDVTPGLSPCPRPDMIRQMYRQHFRDKLSSLDLITCLDNVTRNTPCWQLNYSGGEQAVELMFKLARET